MSDTKVFRRREHRGTDARCRRGGSGISDGEGRHCCRARTGAEAVIIIDTNGNLKPMPASYFDDYRTGRSGSRAPPCTRLESFIEHVNRFKQMSSALFAIDSMQSPSLTAVLNYHEGLRPVWRRCRNFLTTGPCSISRSRRVEDLDQTQWPEDDARRICAVLGRPLHRCRAR
jgi:hypothetical protein